MFLALRSQKEFTKFDFNISSRYLEALQNDAICQSQRCAPILRKGTLQERSGWSQQNFPETCICDIFLSGPCNKKSWITKKRKTFDNLYQYPNTGSEWPSETTQQCTVDREREAVPLILYEEVSITKHSHIYILLVLFFARYKYLSFPVRYIGSWDNTLNRYRRPLVPVEQWNLFR